jgi:protein-L-isoaspartate(D-aspartate) O-methyltransferase
LARLARHVVGLEQDATLARHARENLAAVGAANAEVVEGTLTEGWSAGAPFDVILINGTAEVVPDGLLRQLAEGGRLLAVVGRAPASKASLYLESSGQVSHLPIFDAAAPALPGFAQPPAFVF